MNRSYFNALVASLGSGLEYFSFITFALQAQYISLLFFPNDSHIDGIFNIFFIFAVGSFVTVIGGCIFGRLGDQFGRKTMFLYAVLLMSLASLGIAVLPVHLGMLSLSLLIILRILQGISQGAELPGAITFIVEHAEDHNKGKLCGFMFLGVGLGAGLATSINVILAKMLTFNQMLEFGWRIPFFAAVLLGLVGFILRKNATETPIFLAYHSRNKKDSTNKNSPLNSRLHQNDKEYWLFRLTLGFGLVFLGATMVSMGLYWPAFLTTQYHFAANKVFFAIMMAFILTAFLLPIFGALGDYYGRGKVFLTGVVLTMFTLPFLFKLLNHGHLFIFTVSYYFLIVILAGNYPVMLTELFPPEKRYFSVALSYAGCYALASFAPMVATFLLIHHNGLLSLILLIEGCGLLSLLASISYVKIVQKY